MFSRRKGCAIGCVKDASFDKAVGEKSGDDEFLSLVADDFPDKDNRQSRLGFAKAKRAQNVLLCPKTLQIIVLALTLEIIKSQVDDLLGRPTGQSGSKSWSTIFAVSRGRAYYRRISQVVYPELDLSESAEKGYHRFVMERWTGVRPRPSKADAPRNGAE